MMERLRAAWQVLRGYAAAQDHRASAWAPSGGSANAEVGTPGDHRGHHAQRPGTRADPRRT